MSTQTWQKACTCEGATATSGRRVFHDPPRPYLVPGGFAIAATWYPGPVCDKCDTPWTLAPDSRPS